MVSSKWIVGRSSPLWGQTVKIRISNYVLTWPLTPTKDWIYPQLTWNWSLAKWCIKKSKMATTTPKHGSVNPRLPLPVRLYFVYTEVSKFENRRHHWFTTYTCGVWNLKRVISPESPCFSLCRKVVVFQIILALYFETLLPCESSSFSLNLSIRSPISRRKVVKFMVCA